MDIFHINDTQVLLNPDASHQRNHAHTDRDHRIFGMNFGIMPLLKNASRFRMAMGAMLLIVMGLLMYFRSQRYLEDQLSRRREWGLTK